MTAKIPNRFRRKVHITIIALGLGGICATGAMTVGVPVACAIPESTIKKECEQGSGTYGTVVVDGKRHSWCCYKDINGKKHCDYYLDGAYNFTDDNPSREVGPPTETKRPPLLPPSPEVVGPVAPTTTLPPKTFDPSLPG
jgi:hypothetical protein